jgi:hypothetical protein
MGDIERGYRLISDDELWPGKSTGDGDTLTLTSRELMGVTVHIIRFHSYFDQRSRTCPSLSLAFDTPWTRRGSPIIDLSTSVNRVKNKDPGR